MGEVKRRSGRPRKPITKDEPEAVQARRARMRIAQKTFHERRKELVESQEQKIQAMQATILGLADAVLTSSFCVRDKAVVRKVGEAMELLVSFGGEDVGGAEDESFEVKEDVSRESSKSDGGEAMEVDHTTTAMEPVPPVQVTHEYLPSPPWDMSTASGWFGGSQFPFLLPTNSILDAHPFALRVLESTLNMAYGALTGSRGYGADVALRLFRYAFLYHSRDEITNNIGWVLGAGRSQLHRLWDPEFMHHASADATFKAVMARRDSLALVRAVDVDASEKASSKSCGSSSSSSSGSSFSGSSSRLFWSAREVEDFFLAHGAKFVDADTIEMDAAVVEDLPRTTLRRKTNTAKINHFWPQAVFPERIPSCPASLEVAEQQSRPRIVLKAALLFQNLANISLCMADGPGYYVEAIANAIRCTAVHAPCAMAAE